MPQIIVEAIDAKGETTYVSVSADGPVEAVKRVERDGLRVVGVRHDQTLLGDGLRREEDRRSANALNAREMVEFAQPESLLVHMWAATRFFWRKAWWFAPVFPLAAWLEYWASGRLLYGAVLFAFFAAFPPANGRCDEGVQLLESFAGQVPDIS